MSTIVRLSWYCACRNLSWLLCVLHKCCDYLAFFCASDILKTITTTTTSTTILLTNGWPVPEETFTHSHLSWSSIIVTIFSFRVSYLYYSYRQWFVFESVVTATICVAWLCMFETPCSENDCYCLVLLFIACPRCNTNVSCQSLTRNLICNT